ncbi:MAG: type II toxin-antitoxin system RelE/ParE family toxin [Candidatus Gracilibacteria bacterium]|nr:type II toxin-antitoxin system RelE/ParE family toxin [Candidatus Gracilibacteria bacterium]
MLQYRVALSKKAFNYLTRLSSIDKERIQEKLDLIGLGYFHLCDIKQYEGAENTYRLRVGNYRIIYERRDSELIIQVIKIGPRGDVYK